MARHAQYPVRCRHFRGIQNVCMAGVDPKSVRDTGPPGPYRWPCLTLIGRSRAETVCPSRQLMTPEDFDAEEDEITAAVVRATKAIGAGHCPACGAKIEPSRIVGRCKYAACGHRLGQVATPESHTDG
jgi:hypothetical protein